MIYLISKYHQWTHTLHCSHVNGSKILDINTRIGIDWTKSRLWVILSKRTPLWENLRFYRFSNLSNFTQAKLTNNNTKTYQIVPHQGCTNEIINTYKLNNPIPTNDIISNLPTRCDRNPSKGIGPYFRGYCEPIVLGEGLFWVYSVRVGWSLEPYLKTPNKQF